MKKNLLEKPLTGYMKLIIKHSLIVLLIIAAITAILGWAATKIQLDTNIFAYMSSVDEPEFVLTPETKPEEVLKLNKIGSLGFIPERGEVLEVPYRDKSGITDDIDAITSNYEYKEIPATSVNDNANPNRGYGDGYVIVFTSKQMFTKEVQDTISEVRENLSKRYEIGPCLSPYDYVTVEKHGTRLAIVPIAPVKMGEKWTDDDIAVFKERLQHDSIAKNYLYTEDGSTIMLYYRARGINAESLVELDTIVNPLRQYGKVALNGGGMINEAVMKYLNKDLIVLVSLCFVVILIVFYLSFRSLKSMLIPASMSLIGIIWTLGTMALCGYDLTIVTILTPCLVLTLGSSYSIHMVSEFFEAIRNNERDKLASHFAKITKTIFFAMLTTISGFLSFLICRTEIFKEFGITIAIGVAYCGLLAFTYLPAILSRFKNPRIKQMQVFNDGIVSKGVGRISIAISRYWYIFLIIALLIFGWFLAIKDDVGFDSNYMNYFPDDDPIVADSLHFARTLGGTDPYYFTIKAPNGEKNFFLQKENLDDVYAFEQAIQSACPDIVNILSFSQYVSFLNEVYNGESGIPDSNGLINLLNRTLKQIGNNIGTDVLDMLINADGTEMTLSIRNYDSVEGDLQTTASAKRLEATLDYFRYMLPEGTESKIWCSASDSVRSIDIIMNDQNNATMLSYFLIFILAAVAFISIPYGIAALVPVCIGVMINYIFMWCAGISFDIVTVGFSSIAIGAGVDDAIHFILRYKMKKKENPNARVEDLIQQNIVETGRAIILTTVSIDAGMVMLCFGSFRPIKYFGILMCVALTAAMLATLFILPPVIIAFSKLKSFILRKKK